MIRCLTLTILSVVLLWVCSFFVGRLVRFRDKKDKEETLAT